MSDLSEKPINEVFPKRSEVAIVLGNGPSLTGTEKDFAADFEGIIVAKDPVVIGVNRIFKPDYNRFRPVHYYIALDRRCPQEYWAELRELRCLRYFIYERYQIARIPRICTFGTNSDYQMVSRDRRIAPGHNFTSVSPATQLALMQGAKEIHFFGTDCAPDKDGKTHGHGNMRRKQKQWNNIVKGTLHTLERLREYGISYVVHSDIFAFEDVKEFSAVAEMV